MPEIDHRPDLFLRDAERNTICALILCGGRGQRMGGKDKGLIPYRGSTMIEQVVNRLRPQVDQLLISANRHLAEYQVLATSIADQHGDFQGPLAGIDASLAHISHRYLAVVPCDSPALPRDLIARLYRGLLDAPQSNIAIVHDSQRVQPLFMLMPRSTALGIASYLKDGGRSVMGWLEQCQVQEVRFDDPEAFININSPQELTDNG